MSMTKEALIHLQNSSIAGKALSEDYAGIVVPDGYRLESLESFQKHKNHFEALYHTHRIEDFAVYLVTNDNEHPMIFIDVERMTAGVTFDSGTPDLPGHCMHRSNLALKQTPEYTYMSAEILNRQMHQQQLAEFVEDYASILMCADSNGEPITPKKAAAAFRRVTVETKASQERDVQSYTTKQSAMEKVEARSGDNPLPAFIVITCALYQGLPEFQIKTRVSLFTGRGAATFGVRPINLDKVIEASGDAFRAKLASELPGYDLLMGTMRW